jgi:hypothetical protein
MVVKRVERRLVKWARKYVRGEGKGMVEGNTQLRRCLWISLRRENK